jgi:hypothetical protein
LELHARLLAALETLEAPYREAVVLRFVQELPIAELAQRTRTTPEAARQRVSRGVRRLRERLERGPGGRDAWLSALVATELGREPIGVGLMGAKKFALTAVLAGLAGVAVFFAFASDNVSPRSRTAAGASQPGEAQSGPGSDVVEPADGLRLATSTLGPSSAEGGHRVLAVTDTSGRPIAAAKVWFEANGELLEFSADETGCAKLAPGPDSSAHLFAHAPGFAPGRVPAEAGRIELQELVEFRARIVEDQQAPEAPLTLKLEPVVDLSAAWPESVRSRLTDSLDAWRKRSARTSRDGEFVFAGLAKSWRGSLELPATHVLLDAAHLERTAQENAVDLPERRLALASPLARGAVHVRRLPAVRGRIVRAWDEAPAAGARVTVWVRFEGGAHSPMTGAECGEDGSFEVGMGDGRGGARRRAREEVSLRIAEVVVTYGGHGVGTPARHVREFSPSVATAELGDLRMDAGRTVHFVARDPEGRPVMGARAAAASTHTPGLAPTDREGRGTIAAIPPHETALLIGAPGYAIARFELPAEAGSPSDPVIATLARGPLLELRLDAPPGTRCADWSVRIEGRTGLWAGSDSWGPSSLHSSLAGQFLGGVWKRDSGYALVRFDASGRIALAGLAPEFEMRLQLGNAVQAELRELIVPGLGPTEHRVVALTVDAAPFALRGRVLDLNGAPLAFASVSVHGERTSGAAVSDLEGRFEVPGFVRDHDRVELRGALEGYASARLRGLELTRELEPVEVRLEAGVELGVIVVEADGAPVCGLQVFASADGLAEVCARAHGSGRYAFSSIAPRALTLWTERSGRRFEWIREGTSKEVELELPPHGSLQVEIDTASTRWAVDRWAGVRVSSLEGAPASCDVYPELAEDNSTQQVMATAPPTPLLPGRYRVELLLRAAGPDDRQPSGVRADVEIRASEMARVRLGG